MFPHPSVPFPFIDFGFLRHYAYFTPSPERPLHFQALPHLGSWAIVLAYLRHAAIAPVLAEVADLASVFSCHRAGWQACRSTSHPHFTLGRVPCQASELLGFTRNPFALLHIQFRSEPRRLACFPFSLADPFPLVKPSNYRESFDSLSLDLAFRSSGLPLRLTASTPSSYRTLFALSSPETIRFSRKHKEARRLRDAQGTRLVVKEPLACRFRLTNTLTIPRADSPVNTRNH